MMHQQFNSAPTYARHALLTCDMADVTIPIITDSDMQSTNPVDDIRLQMTASTEGHSTGATKQQDCDNEITNTHSCVNMSV